MRSLANPVHYFVERIAQSPKRVLIGLAGLPGSGKSTITAEWAKAVNSALGQPMMTVLGMDGFHLSKAELQQSPDSAAAFARRGAPWTFDAKGFIAKLQLLRDESATVGWPDFQHDLGDPVANAYQVVPAQRLILVEGLYLLYAKEAWLGVQTCFDEVGYLDTPMALALSRLQQRHQHAWGISALEAQARIASNDQLNAELVATTRERATWVVS